MGLAVAATVSVVSVTFTRLHAQDTTLESAPVRPLSLADGAAASDIDLLKQGLDQFKNKQYDEAKATLAQVNGEMLSKSDQKKLVSTLADADAAAGARRDARAQFDQAEAQLNAGKLNEAKALYKAAADNKFADDATRQKAKEQIALANAMQEQKAGELKAEYQQAKKDFESGNYADAKAKFTKLDAAGFKAPMFQGSPADYLKKTDAKMAAGAADTGTAAVAVDGAKPTAEAPKAEAQPQAVAPVAPAAQPAVTDQTQTAAAPQVDEKAAKEQAKAEKARLEAEAKAAKEADKAKAQEEKAKAQAEAKAAEDNAKAAQAQAREQYKTGLAALKAGDYAAARENFKAADAAGYKPSLFEASAAKMLAEVDQAEAKAKPEVATGDAKAPEADAKAQAQAEKDAAKQKEAEAKAQAEADKVAAKQKEVEAKAQAEADRKAAEAQAEADKAAAKAQANADKVAATTRQVAAREQYKAGLTALKAGDYATARTAFKAADDAGFKPGLFEATGAKMLAEVDKEEADAKAKAEKMAAREAEKAQKAQAEADRKAAEAKAQADKEAAEAQAKADKTAAEATAKTAEAQAKVAETKPEVAAPAVVAKPEGTTPAVEAKPEVKAEGTTPAVETQPAAEAKPVTEAKPVEAAPVVATPTAQAELDATAKMDQIKAQARAYEAQRLVDQAQTAQKEGRTADALDAYTKAAQTDPTNQAAVAGREQMLALQGRVPVASSMLDQVTLRNRAAKQSIAFSFNDAIERARAASAANKFDEADRQVNNAQIARDQDPNLFTTEEIKAFDTTIASTRQEVAAARLAYNQAEQQRVADARIGAEQARLREIKNEQQATIASLIAQSRNYVSKNQYREALSVVDQILSIDPTNDYARGVRPLIEDKSMLQTQREYKQQFNTNWVKSLNAADERLIPYDDIYRLPTNWPDISESRDLIVQGERGLKEADRQVQLALERKLPEVKFDGVPFEDVIEFLRDTTSTNIFVNWKALDQVPIDHKAPVVAGRLRDVRFSKVLQTVLDSVSTDPNNKLTYTVDEGVITISTTQDVSSRTVTRVYDITDLIIQIPSIDIGNADLGTGGAGGGGGGSTGGTRSGGGGGRSSGGGGRSSGGGGRSSGGGGRSSGGGGGGSVFGGGGGGGGSSSGGGGGNGEFDRQASVDDIATLVEETVDVTTWEAAGGQGSIRPSPLNQQLIITQTPEVHRKIQGLLDQLRETLAIQVTVECRFLTVSRNFMDDVGMDFDFTFNPTGSSHWSPIPVAQGSSSFTANPATGVPGTIGTSSPTPSLQTSGTYLDQFRVDYLIRATQASVNQSVVTAPRVTVYNGGEAMVVVTTDTSYVSSLEPEVASGVVGYTPQIDQTTDGVSLFVRANVSADRKYVTLYLRPTLQRVLDLVPFSFQTATTLPTGGASGNTFVSQGSLTIQEPRQQTIQVETLVAVPDGGTLLLGGQTISGEVEREAGVPILSKIPILKRIFTNRSTAKDESVLLLLVKPTIIINKEQEQKQFPLLSSKISGS